MKRILLCSISVLLFLGIAMIPGRTKASNDTINVFPFIEDWSSLSFDTNGWTFPQGQGNWTIMPGNGNPSPCAGITGLSGDSNFRWVLQSPVFDARILVCDDLYLTFDLFLQSEDYTGLEEFSIILLVNEEEHLLKTFSNLSDTMGWLRDTILIIGGDKNCCQILFVASGVSSANISLWGLDNVQIFRRCLTPDDFEVWGGLGYCMFTMETCFPVLSWEPNECDNILQFQSFVFDDGYPEHGWAINPGYVGWLGNEFPISYTYSGFLTSFDVWFGLTPPSAGQLTIDVFDGSRNLVGSSGPFSAPDYNWYNVPVNNIPFSGLFYAMVKWNNLSVTTNYLGFDEDGPYSNDNLGWYFDGSFWNKISIAGGGNPGVFLIRANALIYVKDAFRMNGVNGFSRSDSTLLSGYNIYRKQLMESGWEEDFSYKAFVPKGVTTYRDSIFCEAQYYITAVYENNCESNPIFNDWIVGCYTAVQEIEKTPKIKITPNPASNFVEIISKEKIFGLSLYGMTGQKIKEVPEINSLDYRLDVSSLQPGFYQVMIQTEKGVLFRKLIIRK